MQNRHFQGWNFISHSDINSLSFKKASSAARFGAHREAFFSVGSVSVQVTSDLDFHNYG